MEDAPKMLDVSDLSLPRLLHGEGAVTWPLIRLAGERRYDTRIGLEDTLSFPDGSTAANNGALVHAAREILAEFD